LKWYWEAGLGGLFCCDHCSPNKCYTALDLGTLALIHHSRKIPLDKIWRLRMRDDVKMSLFRGLLDWIRHHTGREIMSLRVLDQVVPCNGRFWR